MIKITITGEKYQEPKVLYVKDYDNDKIISWLNEAYDKQETLNLIDIDGVVHVFPYIALQFVRDIMIEDYGKDQDVNSKG